MSIRRQILRSLLIGGFAFLVLTALVLFPRQLNVSADRYKIVVNYPDLWKTYGANVRSFFHGIWHEGTLGTDRNGIRAETAIGTALSKSLAVIGTSLFLSIGLGILKGIYDYRASGKKRSLLGSGLTWIVQSVPDFLFILLVEWLVIHYYPNIRFFSHKHGDAFLIPSLLVCVYPLLYLSRITSTALAEQEGRMYIQVARSKGIKERAIFYRHVFANCLGTILTHLPSAFVYLFSNLLLVEYFMNYPGIANLLFRAMDSNASFGTGGNYQPGLILGIAFCFLIMLLAIRLVSLLAGRHLDPRKGELS